MLTRPAQRQLLVRLVSSRSVIVGVLLLISLPFRQPFLITQIQIIIIISISKLLLYFALKHQRISIFKLIKHYYCIILKIIIYYRFK